MYPVSFYINHGVTPNLDFRSRRSAQCLKRLSRQPATRNSSLLHRNPTDFTDICLSVKYFVDAVLFQPCHTLPDCHFGEIL